MFDQIDNKRNRFAADKRKMIHEKMFEMNRQWMSKDFNTIALIPPLLEETAYVEIDSILDDIDLQKYDETYITPKVKSQIVSRESSHNDPSVRLIMLKLMNRLNLWQKQHYEKAKYLLINGQESILKELAIFFEVNLQKQYAKNLLKQMSAIVFNYKIKSQQSLLFWVDLLCKGFDNLNSDPLPLIKDIDNLMFSIDTCLMSKNNFYHIRIVRILNKLVADENIHERISRLQGLGILTKYISQGTVDFVQQGIQLLAQLLCSSNSNVIHTIVVNYKIIDLLQPFIHHLFDDFRCKSLWAYTNIVGQQLTYHFVLQNTRLMNEFKNLYAKQQKQTVKLQLYYFYLNIFCICKENDLKKLFENSLIDVDILIQVLYRIQSQPNLKPQLYPRFLFSVYNIINIYPLMKMKLQEKGIKNKLHELYERQKEESYINMINQIFQVLKK